MSNSWLWIGCSVVMFSGASLYYWELWKARKSVVDSAEQFSFSPFTLAVLGTFSVLVGFFALSKVVEETFPGELLSYGELVFGPLMIFGVFADFRKRWRKEE